MRITNTMITSNTKANINSNKLLVDKYNTQMTTQKKIAKASENPVIAIRSLRLSTTMSHINQYVDNNIPDANAWMEVTETALTNMKDLLTDIRTQCVNGSTDTKNPDDRKIILDNLKALAEQVYSEGNADYAGKTVFTGYRTSSNLTFEDDELDTKYEIDQSFDFSNLEEKRYYTGTVKVPETLNGATECDTKIAENTYERIRLAYNGDTTVKDFTYKYAVDESTNLEITAVRQDDGSYEVKAYNAVTNADGTITRTETTVPADVSMPTVKSFESEEAWEADTTDGKEIGKTVGDNEIIFIEATGEFVFGKNIANNISDKRCSIDVTYTKTGFDAGELRPEYYYDCKDITDDDVTKHVQYMKQNQEIRYTIANNTTMVINTQADEVFDSNILRDVQELINVVQRALDATDKVTQIENMMNEAQYQDAGSQKMLQGYLDVAKKEMDYADDNLQKTYEAYIGRFDGYMQTVNIAITNIGSMGNSLKLTQTRVENQQMTIEELKSDNEDRDISDIIIDYYASYNAYQSSLTAAGKLGERSLLDYI
ncbi:MAG: flagellar biosynthesis protein FlgL [Agathobacter sp.]|nr:flagellar biosynthesis protein FlgL [Agathobacter sp.]